MDVTGTAAILGAVLPFLISFIKRFWTLTSQQTYGLVFILCFLVTAGVEVYQNGWELEKVFINFSVVLATSQLIYAIVMKSLELDTRIEGK